MTEFIPLLTREEMRNTIAVIRNTSGGVSEEEETLLKELLEEAIAGKIGFRPVFREIARISGRGRG